MKCFSCGHWGRVPVNKIFIEEANPIEPKVKVLIPMYEPLELTRCKKCGEVMVETKELIRNGKGKRKTNQRRRVTL